MADVFVLGAGFSKAVHELAMPITDELGERAVRLLQELHRVRYDPHSVICDGLSCDHPMLVGGKFPAPTFEEWLSKLAEPQPYLVEHENAVGASWFDQLAGAVAFEVQEATKQACRQDIPSPDWFPQLITAWHERRARVVTFNYDTLIEAQLDALSLPNGSPTGAQRMNYRHLGPVLLPHYQPIGGGATSLGSHRAFEGDSFKFYKLHGSIHWYWDPVTRSADSMVEIGLPAKWGQPDNEIWDPAERAPGRRPVIVPPTTTKTSFFANPTIRFLWRSAYEQIRSASQVIFVGYSLPAHDTLVASMLADAAHWKGGINATVVDLTPDPIAERLTTLGYTVTAQHDTVDEFVAAYTP